MLDIDYKALGKQIKIARIQNDLSQEKLAEAVDISLTHMSNIETGNARLSLPKLVKIANNLSVTTDALLCDSISQANMAFVKEASDIFKDCNGYETRVLVDILKAAKASLRYHQKDSNT